MASFVQDRVQVIVYLTRQLRLHRLVNDRVTRLGTSCPRYENKVRYLIAGPWM